LIIFNDGFLKNRSLRMIKKTQENQFFFNRHVAPSPLIDASRNSGAQPKLLHTEFDAQVGTVQDLPSAAQTKTFQERKRSVLSCTAQLAAQLAGCTTSCWTRKKEESRKVHRKKKNAKKKKAAQRVPSNSSYCRGAWCSATCTDSRKGWP
jgi:hypothetical protein